MENKKLQQNSEMYSGKIAYTMKNDFMFKVVFQENRKALEGILCALLGLDRNDIESIAIVNPIEYGDRVDDKTMVLDIKLIRICSELLNRYVKSGNAYACKIARFL